MGRSETEGKRIFFFKFLEPILLDLKKQSSGTCGLSTLDAETGRTLGVQGPARLQSEFQESRGYRVRSCLRKNKVNQNNKPTKQTKNCDSLGWVENLSNWSSLMQT